MSHSLTTMRRPLCKQHAETGVEWQVLPLLRMYLLDYWLAGYGQSMPAVMVGVPCKYKNNFKIINNVTNIFLLTITT